MKDTSELWLSLSLHFPFTSSLSLLSLSFWPTSIHPPVMSPPPQLLVFSSSFFKLVSMSGPLHASTMCWVNYKVCFHSSSHGLCHPSVFSSVHVFWDNWGIIVLFTQMLHNKYKRVSRCFFSSIAALFSIISTKCFQHYLKWFYALSPFPPVRLYQLRHHDSFYFLFLHACMFWWHNV